MTKSATRKPGYLSVAEVALEIGVSEKTIRRFIKAGRLHVNRPGRRIVVSHDDLALFMLKNRK